MAFRKNGAADVACTPCSATTVPAVKSPFASRATIALAVLAEVALLVTVNVELPDALAVNEAEPNFSRR